MDAVELLKIIFTALLGSILTVLVQSFLSKRANSISEITEHAVDIGKIEEAATAYWTLDSSVDENYGKELELAAKLKGMLNVTKLFRERSSDLLGDLNEHYINLDGHLFDIATGGTFEQKDRKPDYKTVTEVIETCHELRTLLRRARANTFQLRPAQYKRFFQSNFTLILSTVRRVTNTVTSYFKK